MTMFSQKPPFDLAKFLSEPATVSSRRFAASNKTRKAFIAADMTSDDYDEPAKKKAKRK